MKTKFKNRVIFFVILSILLAAFAFWYKATYSMSETTGVVINTKEMPIKIAIASQGSAFKNAMVTNIINHYKKDSVFINVDDVSKLTTLSLQDYNAIVILHTWEYGKPPMAVSEFIEKNISEKNKIIVFASSGAGNNKIEGVDAIAGESILENTGDYTDRIIEKIEKLIR